MKTNRTYILMVMLLSITISYASKGVDAFIASPATDPASVAVYVFDLHKKRLTEHHNIDKPLIPASVMKSVTIATLLNKVGTDYRYHTKVYTDGVSADTILYGDILVIGSGDPSLNSRQEPKSADIVAEIADALMQKNVRAITGAIKIDESIFSGPACPPSWQSGDLSHSYGTGSHGLNFENNASGSRAVKNPAATFRNRLTSALAGKGIKIGISSISIPDSLSMKTSKELLVDHISSPVEEIMRSCMIRSDNLFAESFLRTYGVELGSGGSTATSAKQMQNYWKDNGKTMSGVKIVDGSGLSRENRLTARFLGEVLRAMADDVDYVSFFPLAGQEGTLAKFLKGSKLDSYIALKTGSMNGIQCYAGYKLDDDFAPTHVVVIMANDMKDRSAFRKSAEQMLLEIFKQ